MVGVQPAPERVAERLDRPLADSRHPGAHRVEGPDELLLVSREARLDEDDVHGGVLPGARIVRSFGAGAGRATIASMRRIVLLGPQRLKPTLIDAVARLDVKGPFAAITAGWQEREDEIDELSAHLDRRVVNLRLHARGEDVFQRDPEILLAYGDYLDRSKKIQDLYRVRLGHAKDAVRELLASSADPDVLEPEIESAIATLRTLDHHHGMRLNGLREAFETEWRPAERTVVAEHRAEISEILSRVAGLAVAGGHVQVLLDRMRLFDVGPLTTHLPVFAWSAGAMVVSEKVVLFHDFPPQGAGNAELIGDGLGLCRGVLPLPHAKRRLDLTDEKRVSLLARRFAPLTALAMDEGSWAVWRDRGGLDIHQGKVILADGHVTEIVGA